MTMRVRPEAGGIICPQAPSKDTSGTALPFQGTVPMYQGGAPVISDGVWKPITSATQARGMMQPPVDQRHQQAVDLGDALGHGLQLSVAPGVRAAARRRSTSGAMASSSCASW